LNDVNIPKFTSNDIPLFNGITSDLFPGIKLPELDYAELMVQLKNACVNNNL
jgi:dynein heavy chain